MNNSSKAFASLKTLPIRHFKSRLAKHRWTEEIALNVHSEQPDNNFYTRSEPAYRISQKLRSLVDQVKRDSLSRGLVGACFKNYMLKQRCFVILKAEFIQPGLWQNYSQRKINLGSYEACFNPEILDTSEVLNTYSSLNYPAGSTTHRCQIHASHLRDL